MEVLVALLMVTLVCVVLYMRRNRGHLETLGIPIDPPGLILGSEPRAIHKTRAGTGKDPISHIENYLRAKIINSSSQTATKSRLLRGEVQAVRQDVRPLQLRRPLHRHHGHGNHQVRHGQEL